MKSKRLFDIVASIILLIILSPILISALFISLLQTRAFPVFTQNRGLSLDKPLFKIYKIRTIKKSKKNVKESGRKFLFSPGSKEQVPRFCKTMRLFGIDELPQLINVIKGEMSLVGPRPLDTFDLEILCDDFPEENFERCNLKCKTGITGLWQFYGRRSQGAENLLYWDKIYESNVSLFYDIKVLKQGISIIYNRQKEDSILDLDNNKPITLKTAR